MTLPSYIAHVAYAFFQDLYPFSAKLHADGRLEVRAHSVNGNDITVSTNHLLFGIGFTSEAMYKGLGDRNNGGIVEIAQLPGEDNTPHWEINNLPWDRERADNCKWSLAVSDEPANQGEVSLVASDGCPGQYFKLVPYKRRCCS